MYDPKTKKKFNPKDTKHKTPESLAKTKAKRDTLKRLLANSSDNVILKSMADDVNRADTEEDALKKELRYNKYKEMFKQRKGG